MSRLENVSIALIAARARNGVIGNTGALPWQSKSDLAFFRRNTVGHPVIMGRKTWEALPSRPLPKRFNIVVSRTPQGATDSSAWCTSIEDALQLGRRLAATGLCQLHVIGGAEIYRAALPYADSIALTEMPFEAAGDATFPALEPTEWRVRRRFHLEMVESEHHLEPPEVLIYERFGEPARLA